MADDFRPAGGPEPLPAPGERLESWKEIAAYLRRDVRTVQRWERTDGLPVHRHKRAHRPIPYAYKSELDAWWTGRADTRAAGPGQDAPQDPSSDARPFFTRRRAAVTAALLAIATAAGAYRIVRSHRATASAVAESAGVGRAAAARAAAPPAAETAPQKSVAVLPFLDLTEGMQQEEFADGMTEELIDRLNKIPGLRVPAPTSSFYFKNKRVPVAEIAKALRVAYVLDGSVRKSGVRVRVAARLIRADTADVVWSETYDRPWNDILIVQDDIAGEVTRALKTSIAAGPAGGAPSQ
jgi:TolB-like protein